MYYMASSTLAYGFESEGTLMEIRKGFQNIVFEHEFKKIKPTGYELYLRVHRYDNQKMKSLLAEVMNKNSCKIEWNEERGNGIL